MCFRVSFSQRCLSIDRMHRKSHKQKWAKVNTPVDSGIAELIDVLSCFPRLQTTSSCQNISEGTAYISFYYGDHWKHPWRDLAEFVLGYIGPVFARRLGDRVNLSIYMPPSGQPYAELTIRKGAMKGTIKVLRQLLKELNLSGPSIGSCVSMALRAHGN